VQPWPAHIWKLLERQVGIAEQLIERHVALLNRVFRLQLRGHDRDPRGVEIGLRTGLRAHQLALAIDIMLLEFDIFPGEVGQRIERFQVGLQFVEIAARGIELRLCLLKGESEGLAIKRKQFVAGIDVLALTHSNMRDLARDIGRDQDFLCADVSIVG
jgi:hypothetical protein